MVAILLTVFALSAAAMSWQAYRLRKERSLLIRSFQNRLRVRSQLVRAAAHELRQPLNGIVGLVANMRSTARFTGRIREEVAGKLDLSIRELNTALINTLEIFELSTGDLELEPEPVDLRSETKLLLRKINRELLETKAPLKVLAGHLPELWVEVDPLRLRQCLRTLIDQAVAQSKEGAVRVSFRVEQRTGADHTIVFTVRDNGRGMDQHRADRFFDPAGFELNPALKGRPSAMLALNLAANVAELMGGGIRAESNIGSGTSFLFTLKAESCPPLEIVASSEPLHDDSLDLTNPSFENLSVLLVDDNEVNLFVLQEFVMPLDFGRVVCATGGQEAIDRARSEAFDLILMDLAMPEIDGFTASSAIREEGKSAAAPILAVSAEHMKNDDARLRNAGIDGFIPKPVVNADLFAAILKVTPQMLENARARGVEVDGGHEGSDRVRLTA